MWFLIISLILLVIALALLADLRRPRRGMTTDSGRQEERFFANPGPHSRPWSRR
jgi:hypothetical protein